MDKPMNIKVKDLLLKDHIKEYAEEHNCSITVAANKIIAEHIYFTKLAPLNKPQ